jgi:hypothetical protein
MIRSHTLFPVLRHGFKHIMSGALPTKATFSTKSESDAEKERRDWMTFLFEAAQMTEEDVKSRITTPAVLKAFERAKLSNLPPDVRKEYDEECRRKEGQPEAPQSVMIVVKILGEKVDSGTCVKKD